MAYFGLVAAILAIIAVIFFIPVMVGYVQTGYVPKYPTLIACGFTMMAAIQSFFTGFMLQTMVQKNRQDFEMELIRVKESHDRRI